MQRSLLLITLATLVACGDKTETGETDETDTDDTNTSTQLTAGTYDMAEGEVGGTCGTGTGLDYMLYTSAYDLAVTDAGFNVSFDGGFGNTITLTCTTTANDFTCTGDHWTMNSEDDMTGTAEAGFDLTATGAIASATEFSIVVEGNLTCTGDAAICTDWADSWTLTMPCTMTQGMTGTLAQ